MGVAFLLALLKCTILKTTYALLVLIWLYAPIDARAPVMSPARLITRPADYYQVIITNNLFRPLGRTPPKAPPAFELIATVMKSDGKHKALIRNTRNGKVYYSPIGEFAEGAIVEKIESRRVTVNHNGVSTVYTLPDF